MIGFHALWRADGSPLSPSSLDDLDVLVMALSALSWRATNGPMLLFCDEPYRKALGSRGLLGLWDEVDSEALSIARDVRINRKVFWSFGKVLAFAKLDRPCASVDTDMIVWRDLRQDLAPLDLAFTHWESRDVSPWYPQPRSLSASQNFPWGPEHDAPVPAANASFVFLGADGLRRSYCEQALAFAVGNWDASAEALGVAPELLFAEQCLLTLLAAYRNDVYKPLINAVWSPEQDRFLAARGLVRGWRPHHLSQPRHGVTHLWFWKADLRASRPRYLGYCRRAAAIALDRFAPDLRKAEGAQEVVSRLLKSK